MTELRELQEEHLHTFIRPLLAPAKDKGPSQAPWEEIKRLWALKERYGPCFRRGPANVNVSATTGWAPSTFPLSQAQVHTCGRRAQQSAVRRGAGGAAVPTTHSVLPVALQSSSHHSHFTDAETGSTEKPGRGPMSQTSYVEDWLHNSWGTQICGFVGFT